METDISAWLQSQTVEATARYLTQGRRFACLPLDELTLRWTQTTKDADAFVTDRRLRELHSDYASEFSLRHVEPPWFLVKKDWNKIRKVVGRWLKRMSNEDLENFGAAVLDNLQDFKHNLDRPKN